jgi:hypothetical protein
MGRLGVFLNLLTGLDVPGSEQALLPPVQCGLLMGEFIDMLIGLQGRGEVPFMGFPNIYLLSTSACVLLFSCYDPPGYVQEAMARAGVSGAPAGVGLMSTMWGEI